VGQYHVFCDETYKDGFQFRVQGGVWVNHAGWSEVRSAIAAVRAAHPQVQEFKWSNIRGKRPRLAYHDLVDVFFEGRSARHLSFKCIVVDRDEDPSSQLGSHGRDLGFYKAYHLLLRHRLEPGCQYRIRLDKKKGPRKDPEVDVASCLNADMRKWRPPGEVKSCIGIHSHDDDLMQLADVLCGVVGWSWNNEPSSAPSKAALRDHIAGKLRWADLARDTVRTERKFNVWNYHSKKN
jgi:hypothetical protein